MTDMLRPIRVRNYIAVMNSMGIPASAVLQGAGVAPTEMDNPDYLITADQCKIVIDNMLRLRGDTGIGLDIGLATDIVKLGIIGYAMMSCQFIYQQISIWDRYSEPLIGMISKYSVTTKDNGDIVFVIVEPTSANPMHTFCVEEFFAMMCKMGTVNSGMAPEFVSMECSYPPPVYRRRYDEIFNCPIRFGAAQTSATIAREWVNRPVLTKDKEFKQVCLQHCSRILQQIDQYNPVTSDLRKLFLRDPRNIPTVDAAARALGVSPRTLGRRLQRDNIHYLKLVSDFRADLAREYLQMTEMAPKEVAYLLGFNDASAFRRAFKLWTGQTIKEFRLHQQKKPTNRGK